MAREEHVDMTLFGHSARPERMGKTEFNYADASSILTPGQGFMEAYDFSLNPYSGCAFGCTYCYAAFFARDPKLRDEWGYWCTVKENAAELVRKAAQTTRKYPLGKLANASIYMSSVTDPYQPVEGKVGLTRAILEVLAKLPAERQPRLVVQTRGSLVTRDIDLLSRIGTVRVNMTVTTDSETVRKVFEPACPSNEQRLRAVKEVREAGLETCITLTPLLPVEEPERFAAVLLETGVQRYVVQSFHAGQGRFVRGTRDEALRLTAEMGWDDAAYGRTVAILRGRLPSLIEGQAGFLPE